MLYEHSNQNFHYVMLEEKIFLDIFHYVYKQYARIILLALFADMYACTYVIMWILWTYLHLTCCRHMIYEHILSMLNCKHNVNFN